MYTRNATRTFFLLPTMAVGVDEAGYCFVELAWLCWAIGFGSKYEQ